MLYLQANRISRIENLEWLSRPTTEREACCGGRLQFLALQCNQIVPRLMRDSLKCLKAVQLEAKLENLKCLESLEFLDLSRNQIALPPSLYRHALLRQSSSRMSFHSAVAEVCELDFAPLRSINMLNLRGNACTQATCPVRNDLRRDSGFELSTEASGSLAGAA